MSTRARGASPNRADAHRARPCPRECDRKFRTGRVGRRTNESDSPTGRPGGPVNRPPPVSSRAPRRLTVQHISGGRALGTLSPRPFADRRGSGHCDPAHETTEATCSMSIGPPPRHPRRGPRSRRKGTVQWEPPKGPLGVSALWAVGTGPPAASFRLGAPQPRARRELGGSHSTREPRGPPALGVAETTQPLLTEATQDCATAAGCSCLEVTSRFNFEIAWVVNFASIPSSTLATPGVSTDLRITGTM